MKEKLTSQTAIISYIIFGDTTAIIAFDPEITNILTYLAVFVWGISVFILIYSAISELVSKEKNEIIQEYKSMLSDNRTHLTHRENQLTSKYESVYNDNTPD